ncbi:hypothetical protein T4E_7168 [Trichinella pseudospiralis]|uniref:Uncharacterized protein n=1 Tax=Trichinella pseudospiralis TaxID=6337 RepID=A0A0V0XIN7_TRIPS|nr:hypothetical protein T4E_7168 [Trichinella pseudospiralis]
MEMIQNEMEERCSGEHRFSVKKICDLKTAALLNDFVRTSLVSFFL